MQQIGYRKGSFSKIRELFKEKIITLLFTLMFSGINILVKTWKDGNWYDGSY